VVSPALIHLWDVRGEKEVGLQEGMAYSPDGRWLSVIADDGMVRLLDTQEEKYVIITRG